jgi:hypothetical protein
MVSRRRQSSASPTTGAARHWVVPLTKWWWGLDAQHLTQHVHQWTEVSSQAHRIGFGRNESQAPIRGDPGQPVAGLCTSPEPVGCHCVLALEGIGIHAIVAATREYHDYLVGARRLGKDLVIGNVESALEVAVPGAAELKPLQCVSDLVHVVSELEIELCILSKRDNRDTMVLRGTRREGGHKLGDLSDVIRERANPPRDIDG